jgi:hypothetical protein
MGLFWDIIQHNQLSAQAQRSTDLEERVHTLERELAQTRQVMMIMLERLEKHVQVDLDGDGLVAK